MAELKIYKRSKTNWTPVTYAANETFTMFNVAIGDLVLACFARVRTAFDGDVAIAVGDDGDVDRFMTTTNVGATSTGLKRGTGAGFTETLGYLYTAANTIDITYTSTTGTVGALDVWCYIAKVDPH